MYIHVCMSMYAWYRSIREHDHTNFVLPLLQKVFRLKQSLGESDEDLGSEEAAIPVTCVLYMNTHTLHSGSWYCDSLAQFVLVRGVLEMTTQFLHPAM